MLYYLGENGILRTYIEHWWPRRGEADTMWLKINLRSVWLSEKWNISPNDFKLPLEFNSRTIGAIHFYCLNVLYIFFLNERAGK